MSMEKWTRMNCGVGYGRHGSVPLRSHSGELPAQNTVSWEPPPASPWVPRLHFSWGCFYLMDGAHWGVHAGPFPLVQDFPHGQPWLETSYQIMPTLRTSWWSGILPIQVFLSSLWSQVSDLNLRLRFPLPLSVPSPFIFHRPFLQDFFFFFNNKSDPLILSWGLLLRRPELTECGCNWETDSPLYWKWPLPLHLEERASFTDLFFRICVIPSLHPQALQIYKLIPNWFLVPNPPDKPRGKHCKPIKRPPPRKKQENLHPPELYYLAEALTPSLINWQSSGEKLLFCRN